MTAGFALVATCDCCAGKGECDAISVTDRLAPPVRITCPLCQGLGARLVAKDTQ